jgi:hypothetical protein
VTGTAKTKPPKNDAEWARNTEKRLNAAENPTAVRIGEWVLSTDPDTGNLIGSHVDGGSKIIAVKPAASENPDDIVSSATPYIKLERQQNQNAPRGSAQLVQWDTVASQTSDWGFSPPGTDIDIPVDGIYEVKYHLAFLNSSTVINKAVLLINATVVGAQEDAANGQYCSFYISDTFNMNAGDIVSCAAYVAGSGTMDFGSSGADPTVHTSLSIKLISDQEV